MKKPRIQWNGWQGLQNITAREFTCGYCGHKVGSQSGYFNNAGHQSYIYICPNCGCPSFFDMQGNQFPGPLLGREIKHLPDDVASVYQEMRETCKDSSYTATILLGRKLIMHIAVSAAGANPGDTFVNYINHLNHGHHIPPTATVWLEYMREMGNEQSHEITIGTRESAEKIIKFVEMLLIFMYEFPGEMNQKNTTS